MFQKNYMAALDGAQQLNANTGFMILRGKNTKVHQLVNFWSQCVEQVEGCDAYRSNDFMDQSAWNKYVRPQFGDQELILLPCSEANGYSGESTETFGCTGRFVSHHWDTKERVAILVKEKLLEAMTKELTSLVRLKNTLNHNKAMAK